MEYLSQTQSATFIPSSSVTCSYLMRSSPEPNLIRLQPLLWGGGGVLTLSCQVVMVVMVNVFGVTGDEGDRCSLRYLKIDLVDQQELAQVGGAGLWGSTDLVVLEGVEPLPVALDHRRQVLVRQDQMTSNTRAPL